MPDSAARPPAPLGRRFAALFYEALLAGAVTAIALLPAGIAVAILDTLNTFSALSSLTALLVLLAVWWLYFKANWHKQGQTLPMRVWQIGLYGITGARPPLMQLRLRFMWACIFIVFIPLLVYALMRNAAHIPPKAAFGAALAWWILPWGFSLFNRDRQFLYDYLASTRLVDLKNRK